VNTRTKRNVESQHYQTTAGQIEQGKVTLSISTVGCCMRKPFRRAFSLFELLVILALLGLLFALLLPALAKVRQTANRTRSQNNLKQIGIAVHAYLDVNALFPPGDDDNHFSAAAYLLPYVEQDNLFKLIDFKKPVTDKANDNVRQVMVKVFLSPDDPRERVQDKLGATNYLFNAGAKPSLTDNDGVFFRNSKIALVSVTDGLSNTLMIGETLKGDGGTKAVDVRRQHVQLKEDALNDLNDDSGVKDFANNKHIVGDRCASWLDGRFLQGTLTGTRVLNDKKPDVNCGGTGGLSGLRSLGNTSNIALCDGSARSVSEKVSLDIWKLLAGRNDGMPLPDF
jgi:type II secretory pathway pseudopilin PulG